MEANTAQAAAAQPCAGKVLHFRQSSQIWGPERAILDLCRELPKHGFPCEIAVLYRKPPAGRGEHPLLAAARAQGIPAHQLDGHLHSLPSVVNWLCRKLRRERFSILHTHEYKTDLLGVAAATLMGAEGPALVATVRHTEPSLQMRAFQGLDSLILGRFDGLTVSSEAALRRLGNRPKLLARTRVIRHHEVGEWPSLDEESSSPAPPETSGGPVISIIGRLEAVKNHRLFLESARRVLDHKRDARFWIVGEGELRPKLEALARRLELGPAVSFLGYRTDIGSVLKASEVLVISSSYEAGPRVLCEGFALAKPVVATAVGGIPELLRDGETGILVPPNDPEALAAAILRLLEDRGLSARMAAAGRRRLLAWRENESPTAALAELYREVMARRI